MSHIQRFTFPQPFLSSLWCIWRRTNFPIKLHLHFVIDSWSVEHLLNRSSNIFRHNKTRSPRNSGTSGKQTEGMTSTCTWINLKAFDPCQHEESVSQAELMSWWEQTKKNVIVLVFYLRKLQEEEMKVGWTPRSAFESHNVHEKSFIAEANFQRFLFRV